jgi:hypothetical protein
MAIDNKATDVITGKKNNPEATKVVATEAEVGNGQKTKMAEKAMVAEEYYCDALNEHNVNKIADGSRLNIVAIVGFVDYGKTTFVSTLYHQLLTNVEFCDHVMYDSDTFIGFERRFLIRSLNTPMEETSKRTIKGEDSLLALSLDSKENGRYKLILSDKSGEDYADFTGSEEEIKDYVILSLAHHILFFIDTEKLLHSMASVKYSYNGLVKDLVGHKMISNKNRVSLVFNKHDMVGDQEETYKENKKIMIDFFEDVFKGMMVHQYEIDSTGASDHFASMSKLCKDIMSLTNQVEKTTDDLNWVKKELND